MHELISTMLVCYILLDKTLIFRLKLNSDIIKKTTTGKKYVNHKVYVDLLNFLLYNWFSGNILIYEKIAQLQGMLIEILSDLLMILSPEKRNSIKVNG